jgi:magnesium-transporting ATPase (P-type)
MRAHQLGTEDALAALGTTTAGLSSGEAMRRLAARGPNSVEAVRRASLLQRLAREFTHLFSAILWVAAGLAFIAEWQSPGQGMGRIGIAIVVVIVLSGLFSFWQEWRAEQTLAALRRLLPQRIGTLRDDAVVDLPFEVLVLVPRPGLAAGGLRKVGW